MDVKGIAPVRFRIAPTPSGYLHAGNLLSFLRTSVLCTLTGGELMLRIDDSDTERYRPGYAEHIFRCLEILKIRWKIGPQTVADFAEGWKQSDRWAAAYQLADTLTHHGRTYRCSCSRKDALQRTPGHHLCKNRDLPVTEPAALRLRSDSDQTDVVLIRKDGIPSYNLMSIADDLFFQITHIVRGNDLYEVSVQQSTLLYFLGIQSQILLELHPLIMRAGRKLSKSNGDGAPLLPEIRDLLQGSEGFWGRPIPASVGSLDDLADFLAGSRWLDSVRFIPLDGMYSPGALSDTLCEL